MKENIISFTKLGVVQLRIGDEIKDELTMDDFIERLENAIENDVSKHQVIYNSDQGTYDIFHNGKKYSVYYGDIIVDKTCTEFDILQKLNSLAQLSNKQRSDQNYLDETKEKENRSIDDIVYDGHQGIFYSEDDKLRYLDYCKKHEKKESIFKETWELLTNDHPDAVDWEEMGGLIVSGLSTLGSVIFTGITENPIFAIIFLVSLLDIFVNFFTDGNSLINLILKTILRLVQSVYFITKNTINKLVKKMRFRKIANSVIESELSETISSKAPVKVPRKTNNTNKTLKGESKNLIEKAFMNLQHIEDDELRKTFAKRLDEIIEKYKTIPESEYNKGYSQILKLLSYLDGEIGEQRRKELSTHVMNTDFEKTREIVDNISDIDVKTNTR